MIREPLSRLVREVDQCNPRELGRLQITYLDISSVDNGTKRLKTPQHIAVDSAPSRARQLVHANDVLVSTVRPNLNAVALVPLELDKEIASTGFCVLRPQPKQLCPQYLFYFTQSKAFVTHLTTIANGASYPAVTDNDILETRIPLPELSEQQRIAWQLEQADRLVRTRHYALELADTLLPPAFLELFGDPVTNQMGWKLSPFEEVAPSRLGKMLDANQQTGKYGRPYLRNENVQWDRFDLTDVSVMDFDADDREEFILSPGDLLICEGGEPGRCAIWRGELTECYFQKALHRARPVLSKAIPEYLVQLLWSLARRGGLADHVTSATIAHLTGEKLKLMPIPVPPITLQQQFAALVGRVECLRVVQREALRQAEHLFATLLHRAFSD
jgi:type I restriction enzyme S subunit